MNKKLKNGKTNYPPRTYMTLEGAKQIYPKEELNLWEENQNILQDMENELQMQLSLRYQLKLKSFILVLYLIFMTIVLLNIIIQLQIIIF
ncbi:MAG: hypothetical protein ACPKNR_01835 [Pleomorphochaeta sp.]